MEGDTLNNFRRSDCDLVYLFTNARDEPNIAEWVAHHLLLGFDKIHIFDHKSVIPIDKQLGTNFDNKVIVQRDESDGAVKLNFITQAVNIARRNNASWMLYLDADEFLLFNKVNNVKELLRIFSYADAIGINWLMFGTSGHKTQPSGLLTENFVRSDKIINEHVKTFIRPHTVKFPIPSPHFFYIKNPKRYFGITGNQMAQNPLNPVKRLFIHVQAYIAHYWLQSEEEFYRRKGRPRDDIGVSSVVEPLPDIHNLNNIVPNNQVQYKYSQKIKDFLTQYNITI
jgi:hypothetical protein